MKTRGNIRVASMVLAALLSAAAVPAEAGGNRFDELVQIFQSGNAYQRARAVTTFAQMDDSRVVPILTGLLEDPDDRVRANTAQQLARLADKRSADGLAGALADTNRNVRRWAAAGLAEIGSEQHVPALVSSVLGHLPDSATSDYESRHSASALEAIGKLAPQAPAEIVALLARIPDDRIADDQDWWRLLANIATCLGQIGDKGTFAALDRARESLEQSRQDYQTWYAVRKALAAIGPVAMPFESPVADILVVRRFTKGNDSALRREWARPLVELGQEAVPDLDWALQFRRVDARLALEALGEIGGPSAAAAVRAYITRQAALSPRERRSRHAPVNEALLALLKVDARVATAEEVARDVERLDDAQPQRVVRDVAETALHQIPVEVRIAFYQNVLSSTNLWARRRAAEALGRIGGTGAGEVLSGTLLDSSSPSRALAARALGAIEDYDAMPTLIEAAERADAPAGAIAWALGNIGDSRAVPVLQAMAARYQRSLQNRRMTPRYRLSEEDRLWIAGALARLGVDYEANAAFVRGALPRSMEQAAWLTEAETVAALEGRVRTWHETESYRAVETLTAIGTSEALNALMSLTDVETNPRRLRILGYATVDLAQKREHPRAQHYETQLEVTSVVTDWFVVAQRERHFAEREARNQIARAHPELARRIWAAEATRRLDLARAGQGEFWRYDIPRKALTAVEPIFDAELIPVLERIVAENTSVVDYPGEYSMVKFYALRSLAAGILSEQTGQAYTFVDVDGRTRPGGWNPSLER